MNNPMIPNLNHSKQSRLKSDDAKKRQNDKKYLFICFLAWLRPARKIKELYTEIKGCEI